MHWIPEISLYSHASVLAGVPRIIFVFWLCIWIYPCSVQILLVSAFFLLFCHVRSEIGNQLGQLSCKYAQNNDTYLIVCVKYGIYMINAVFMEDLLT